MPRSAPRAAVADPTVSPYSDIAEPAEPRAVRNDQGEVRLHGSRCRQCGARFFPSRQVCFECGGRDLASTLLGPDGTLYSFSTVHVASGRSTPYTIGYVDLDDGVRVLADIRQEPDRLWPDQRVVIVLAEDGAWAVAPATFGSARRD